jgi:ribonuclease VapC
LIVDSSALIAMLLNEPGSDRLLQKLAAASSAGIGAPTLAEAGIVLTARAGIEGKRNLTLFVQDTDLNVVPFGQDHWRAAVDAFRRYGKGQHPARLNLGDCMTYATAKLAGQPLLCTGSDFSKTDLPIA